VVPHIEDVLLWMISQTGKPYVLGAEWAPGMPPPVAEDCSELVQNACDDAGVMPAMPDGAYYQWTHCVDHSTVLPSAAQGVATRGALLFAEDPFASSTFQTIPHVACSLGDGTTIEARGRAWGVGSFPAAGRFQHAALIPGVDYTPSRNPFTKEDFMTTHIVHVTDGFPGMDGYSPARPDWAGPDPLPQIKATDVVNVMHMGAGITAVDATEAGGLLYLKPGHYLVVTSL
jgi:cell wall-associated NlpC family hydrolase